MTDFYISAVKYSFGGDHLQQVKVRKNLGGKIGPELVVDREFVAHMISGYGLTFQTIIRGVNGWTPGDDIYVLDENLLSTDPESFENCELSDLTKF